MILFVFITILSGCNSNKDSISSRINDRSIVWVLADKPNYLDPGLCGLMDGTDIINNMFEGLFRVIEEDKVSFGVVKSYSCCDDGKTYIFKFRKDAYWSDGKRVLPKDFEFAWKRNLRKDFPCPRKDLFLPLKNASDIIHKNKNISSLGVKAIDDYNLKVELEFPVDYLFTLLSLTPFMPVREDIVDDSGIWVKNSSKVVSNGPFCLSEYSDHQLLLKKNDLYYNSHKSNVKQVFVKFINDVNTAYIGYISDDIDIIDNIPSSEYKKLSHSKEFTTVPYYGLYFYSFNLKLRCFQDKKIRQAISMAIDRNSIIDKIRKSNEKAANESIHPDIMKCIDGNYVDKDIYNPSKAKELFLKTKYSSDEKFPLIEIFYNSENDNKFIAEAIQAMLKKNLNIDVKLTGQEWSIFVNKRKNLQYNGLVKNSHMYEYFNPISFLQMFKSNSNSYTGYSNKVYDIILDKITKLSGDKKNIEIIKAAQILDDDVPIIPLFYYSSSSLVKPHIKNYNVNYIGYKYLGLIFIEN